VCPHHHSSDVRIEVLGSEDAAQLGPVKSEVPWRLGDAEPRDDEATAGASYVVKTGLGSEVMTAAGASSNSGTLTVAPEGRMWRQVRMIRGCEFTETSARSFVKGTFGVAGGSREKCRSALRT
jgi:hypothetical protein